MKLILIFIGGMAIGGLLTTTISPITGNYHTFQNESLVGKTALTAPNKHSSNLKEIIGLSDLLILGGKHMSPAERWVRIASEIATLNSDELVSELGRTARTDDPFVSSDKARFRATLLEQLSYTNPELAFDFVVRNAHSNDLRREVVSVIGATAGKDPDKAVQLIQSLPADISNDDTCVRKCLYAVALSLSGNLEIAEEWASNLPSELKSAAYAGIVDEIAVLGLSEAKKFVERLSDTQLQTFLVNRIADQLVVDSSGKAWDWVQSLPDKDEASSEYIRSVSRTDPVHASQLYLMLGENSSVKEHSLKEVAAAWAKAHPADGLNWVAGLPSGESRTDSLRHLAQTWESKDPGKVLDTVTDLDSEAYDAVVSGIVEVHASSDPEQAISLAGTIADEGSRSYMIEDIATRWLTAEFEPASAWLEKNSIWLGEDKVVQIHRRASKEGRRNQ